MTTCNCTPCRKWWTEARQLDADVQEAMQIPSYKARRTAFVDLKVRVDRLLRDAHGVKSKDNEPLKSELRKNVNNILALVTEEPVDATQ